VTSISTEVRPALRSRFSRYRHSLWLLTKRDLRVRYSTSVLGYLWSILDPLVMSAIYWFVFTVIFKRDVGENPYIVFLLAALLPWMWFNGAVSDSTRAFIREAKLITVSRELGEEHYAEHREKPFFGELVEFITSGPTWALVVEGEGAIATMRATIGATDPANAAPGTIRGDLASSMPDNLVHGSDSPESAEREIALWFGD